MKITARCAAAVLCLFLLMSVCAIPARADNTDAKLLAITFDDGPSANTTTLLNALKERGVKATFFIVGNRISSYFSVVERMYDEGHQICSHTYSHTYLDKVSAAEIKSEIEKAEVYLRAAGGGIDRPIYVRAPGGRINSTVSSTVNSPLIQWSVDPEDWKDRDAATVRKRIVSNAKDGDIILVHDLYKTSVEGAIMAIDDLLAKGFEFVTVDELFYRRGVTPVNGQKYSRARNEGTNLPAPVRPTEYNGKLQDHWAYASISRVLDMGLVTVLNGGSFAPEKGITRGQFAAMLGRLAGVDGSKRPSTGFSDVPSNIYQSPYVLWATQNGIMNGSGDRFRLSDIVTKEEMLTALRRFIDYKGLTVKEDKIPDYSDASVISDWARASINFCKYVGILNRGEYKNCDAQKSVTKAEAAEYICRTIDFIDNPAWYISHNSYAVMRVRAGLVVESIKMRASFWQRIRNWF